MDDVQYGMRGIGNNIPMIVQAFGGSAGLAGGVAIAATALVLFHKALSKLSGDEALLAWQKGQDEAWKTYDKSLEASLNRLKDVKREEKLREDMSSATERESAAIKEAVGLDQHRLSLLEQQTEEKREQRKVDNELRKARQSLVIDTAQGAENQGKAQWRAGKENFDAENAGIADERVAAQKMLNELSKQHDRVWGNIGQKTTAYQVKLGKSQAILAAAREELAWQQPELDRINKALEVAGAAGNLRLRREEETNREELVKRMRTNQDLIATKDAEIKKDEELLQLVKSEGEAAKAQLQQRLDSGRKELQQLDAKKKATEDLAKIEEKRVNTETALAAAAQRKAYAEKISQLAKEGQDKYKSEAQKKRGEADSLTDLGNEFKILRLQAQGRMDAAAALQIEVRLRAEAKEIAERTGMEERKALQVARERERLRKQAADGGRGQGIVRAGSAGSRITRAGSSESRIRRARPDQIGGGRGAINAGGGRTLDAGGGRQIGLRYGLQEHTARQRGATNRGATASPVEMGASRFFENAQEFFGEMKGFMKGIGVI